MGRISGTRQRPRLRRSLQQQRVTCYSCFGFVYFMHPEFPMVGGAFKVAYLHHAMSRWRGRALGAAIGWLQIVQFRFPPPRNVRFRWSTFAFFHHAMSRGTCHATAQRFTCTMQFRVGWTSPLQTPPRSCRKLRAPPGLHVQRSLCASDFSKQCQTK